MLNVEKTPFKSTDAVIYNIKCIAMKNLDRINIDCENFLYLVFNNVDGYIEKKKNENKYSVFASTDKYKEIWGKYTKFRMTLKTKLKQQIVTNQLNIKEIS